MAMRDKDSDNANYDYGVQNQPSERMGRGEFANMPSKPMISPYGRAQTYRDGLVESLTDSVKRKSKISENQR